MTQAKIKTADIGDSQVTYAKIQSVSATSRILGRITAGSGVMEELTAANVFTILGITASATELNYTTGVTSAIQTQLDGKVKTDQTVGQTIGATGARLTKLWATDITVTNAIAGSVTGSAATLTTARAIYGNNFDGSAALTQVIASTYGGTGNGFTKFSGPTTTEKTKTLRDATDTILELGGSYTPTGTWTSMTLVTPALGTPASGNLANCTFPTLNQNTTGSAASLSISGQSGLLTFIGLASTNRAKTVRDAADTILELGGSYTPTGTWTSLTMVTPVLGTPTSGTLTNCSGLPVSGITASTSTALGVGSLEIGHATDTTLSRSSAGVLAVEGIIIPTVSSTSTFTNKRNTKRLVTVNAPGATPTTNTDNCDIAEFTGLATAITSMTTNLSGTPVHGDFLEFMFLDDGTARGITWGSSFANGGLVSLPTTTVISTVLRVLVQYQTTATLNKWVCVAVS